MFRIDGAAELDGPDDAAQVAFHQRDAGALDGHVGAGAHRDADVGLGQRRGIVDAVAGHRDDVPAGAQLAQRDCCLSCRSDAGLELVDAELASATARAVRFVVAGEHENLQAQLVQMRGSPRRVEL